MNNPNSFENISKTLTLRSSESIKKLFSCESSCEEGTLILTSPTDLGVCRNGGRRGSSFAPDAIINNLKKMSAPVSKNKHKKILIKQVTNSSIEETDFNNSQLTSADKIQAIINDNKHIKKIIHLGGGHDHVYPLLRALDSQKKSIHIINIDAHMDTRQDDFPHSGTPFRQFSKNSSVNFKLTQIGIHNFCNSISTQKDLSRANMKIITFDKFRRDTNNFSNNINEYLTREVPIDKQEITILSIDSDAYESSVMEGVSAVNHNGIPQNIIEEITTYYMKSTADNLSVIGIYEYNPIYDNLSQKGSRVLSSLIYGIIFD